ncbi:GGDEF domain-containing protein [Anaeromyxobacter diazotrophicus]|uniref:diguanylate cyclase n=1 Tax=Anaeromyxobacter diazotrophicus TaxID=2590199 RepID=A0A7I9VQF8_9BACT|nr:GGDEF domain-containing protein [Anaeromyxobacter diazotrophicus]GEJ58644.1 GGDEF domain-containing protein [Anaeromyxobacter diazotrophicus]
MSTEETRLSGFAPPGPAAGEGCLVVIHAPMRRLLGARLPLARREVVLGRDAGCDLVLEAEDVSRRHARVRGEGERHLLEDLGSTNGTFVGEERVSARELSPGDHVRVGSVILKYLAGGDLEALYHAEVKRLADEDPLTGLVHKGGFAEALRREVSSARRHLHPLALALLDLDHFKRVNDGFGHLAGDQVLRELAALVRPLVRAEQLFARIGGEELALLLPGVPLEKARFFSEKVRGLVEQHAFLFDGARIPLTVSIGVAELSPEDESPEALVRRADERLYQAKEAGRNRVLA